MPVRLSWSACAAAAATTALAVAWVHWRYARRRSRYPEEDEGEVEEERERRGEDPTAADSDGSTTIWDIWDAGLGTPLASPKGAANKLADAGSAKTPSASPRGVAIQLTECPWHDALAFCLCSTELGRVSCACTALRAQLTVEGGGARGRLLLVPVLELKMQTAEHELQRVSIPHIHVLRIFNRLSFNAVAAAVAHSPKGFRSLDKFSVKGCPMHPGDVYTLLVPAVSCTSVLKLLNLEKNRINDDMVKELCDSGILARIETLNLRFNMITSMGAKSIAGSKGAATLKWINLKMNRVGDDGALALASMVCGSSTMTLLNLRRQTPGLTDRSAPGFAEMLRKNHSLVYLRLRRNKISDAGAATLAAATGERLRRLCEARPEEDVHVELDLESNRIKEPGALALLRAAAPVPERARVELLLHGNCVTRDSLRLAVLDAGELLDANDKRLCFDTKPESAL